MGRPDPSKIDTAVFDGCPCSGQVCAGQEVSWAAPLSRHTDIMRRRSEAPIKAWWTPKIATIRLQRALLMPRPFLHPQRISRMVRSIQSSCTVQGRDLTLGTYATKGATPGRCWFKGSNLKQLLR